MSCSGKTHRARARKGMHLWRRASSLCCAPVAGLQALQTACVRGKEGESGASQRHILGGEQRHTRRRARARETRWAPAPICVSRRSLSLNAAPRAPRRGHTALTDAREGSLLLVLPTARGEAQVGVHFSLLSAAARARECSECVCCVLGCLAAAALPPRRYSPKRQAPAAAPLAANAAGPSALRALALVHRREPM